VQSELPDGPSKDNIQHLHNLKHTITDWLFAMSFVLQWSV